MAIKPKAGRFSSSKAGKQFVRGTDVARFGAAFDRLQDRLQQRPYIAVGVAVAPEAGEIVGGAQFQQAALLAASDFNRSFETGLRARAVFVLLTERKTAAEAMQIGEPEPFTGMFDEGEASREIRIRLPQLACLQ